MAGTLFERMMTNWKAVLFLLASGQGLLLSFALVVKGLRKQRPNLFLGLILYIISLELLNAWGMQVHYHRSPDAFPFWTFQSYLVLPPSIWFFTQFSTTPGFLFRRTFWLAYVPAVAEILVQLGWRFYCRTTGQNLPSLLENPIWFFSTEILPILGTAAAVGWLGYKLTTNSPEKQGRFLSFRLFVKQYGFFGFLVVLTLLWTAGVIIEWPIFFGIELLLTLFLFAYGYLGYADSSYFDLRVAPRIKPTEKPSFAQFDDDQQWKRLKMAFERDALHTQSRLTLEEVADQLQLPPRYVSYLINTYHQSNFNHFVNTLRVEEMIRKINDPAEQHKTLLALALEAGFNSKSSFNQTFRAHTGKSPSHYLPKPTKTARQL
jgi:AraC-like DNA-binding protein